jgi:hypothetical protein
MKVPSRSNLSLPVLGPSSAKVRELVFYSLSNSARCELVDPVRRAATRPQLLTSKGRGC